MDMTLNSLPSKTWNRLGINACCLTIEENLTVHAPETDWKGEDARWQPATKAAFAPMQTGMGDDLAKLVAGAPTDLAETAEGVEMTAPMTLRYHYQQGERAMSRLHLHAAKDSVLSVVLLLDSEGKEGTSILRTEIEAEENARVKLYVVQLLGRKFVCLNDIGGVCAKNAAVELVKLELGAGKLYAGAALDLRGEKSDFKAKVGYYVRTGDKNDMNYVATHHAAKTTSLMEVNGTLEEGAEKAFRGTIDFPRGCPGSKGTENENVLLLGDEMVNQTIPLILCKEEDVEGNHGASIGKLDEKVLFYLSARGISEEAAQQIISKSRIEAICQCVPDERVREAVHEFEL